MLAGFYTLTMNEPIIFFILYTEAQHILLLIITVASLGKDCSHFSSEVSLVLKTAQDPDRSPKLKSSSRRYCCGITLHTPTSQHFSNTNGQEPMHNVCNLS